MPHIKWNIVELISIYDFETLNAAAKTLAVTEKED